MPHMVQPPIEVKNFVSSLRKCIFPQIVSVGRLDPDKRYRDIIELLEEAIP